MKTVRVSEPDQLVIGIHMFPPGAVIDLDDATAADLLGKGRVVPVGPEVSERYPIQPQAVAPIGPAPGGAATRPEPAPSPEVEQHPEREADRPGPGRRPA